MADKGLKSNVVGLFGGTMLGISSVAPAYALTATLPADAVLQRPGPAHRPADGPGHYVRVLHQV